MTTPRARLLAILKEPDRYGVITASAARHVLVFYHTKESWEAIDLFDEYAGASLAAADLNASHRLKRLSEEIAKVARDFDVSSVPEFTRDDDLRSHGLAIAAAILALGEPNEHS